MDKDAKTIWKEALEYRLNRLLQGKLEGGSRSCKMCKLANDDCPNCQLSPIICCRWCDIVDAKDFDKGYAFLNYYLEESHEPRLEKQGMTTGGQSMYKKCKKLKCKERAICEPCPKCEAPKHHYTIKCGCCEECRKV